MSSYSLINIIIFSDNMFDYENIKSEASQYDILNLRGRKLTRRSWCTSKFHFWSRNKSTTHSLIFVDSLDNVPKEYRKLGMQIEFANEKGSKKKFQVTSIDNGKITFDGNHIFAGKHLVYKIKIVDVAETERLKD